MLFVPTILEHLGQTTDASHSTTNASTDVRRMHVLVQLIWIGDARRVESLSSGDQSPKCCAVGLGDNVVGDAISSGSPSSWNLASDSTSELECLRDEYDSAFLELRKPVAAFTSPNVALVAMLHLVLLCFTVGHLDGFEVVDKLNLLVEDLLVRIVATE